MAARRQRQHNSYGSAFETRGSHTHGWFRNVLASIPGTPSILDSSDMQALGLLREVDLFGLRDLDLKHHELSARRAPFDNAKLMLAPFKINNGQTPYTVLSFDPLLILLIPQIC